jgi:hypothetical protein
MHLIENQRYNVTTNAGTFRCRYIATEWNKYTGVFCLIIKDSDGKHFDLQLADVKDISLSSR